MLNIEQAVQEKFPKFERSKPWFKKSTLRFLRRITHEQEVNHFLTRHSQLTGFDFIDEVLDYFNFSYSISNRHRSNIPATGRVVIIANHPLGALDGLSLLKMVGEVRRDVKIVANDMLLNFDALKPLFLPVDNLSKSTRKSSVARIIDSLNQDEAVIVFPAGEVSRIRPSGVRDGKWNSGFLNFAKKTGAPILPVFVGARNSSLFYSASMVYKPLSGMMLAHEMFNKNSKTISMCVGEPIPYAQVESLPLVKAEKAKLLRRHLYRLAKGKKPLFLTEQTVAHPQDRRIIKQELKQAQLLGETADNKKIYLFNYQSDSAVMQEIGRLREMTFRQVGEGTGKKRDLDHYDRSYRHLILWDEQELEIAGAYRIGEVDAIKRQGGEIYSTELFDYQPAMQPYFEQGIELGRSFVSPKYWGKRSLDYLWYGIGAYLKQYPEIRYLFGPVSLSNSYPAYAQALIVAYYQHYFPDNEQLATARVPFVADAGSVARAQEVLQKNDADADFAMLKNQLAHMQMTVPTLYKQYADVCESGGVRFIDFNVDADFGYCVDGLVMVDLHQLKPAKRKRYLGG
ncbi:Putative hemolysin [Methylophaga frappieri]|uniref:L-ornithine N(alpha)-acyltransferase n=1 Tax=Methylophaga frappieri (strain ATCC BAA-2434 / DSM 25690 / JAM7) TaxID=754477 RepID=I1YKY5_METFJ|nr:lysophospholipid acyltransferase family protein [Methylophaga frappieri]AFJ03578.1 Putative hemolysin [Methylophaga frappieri]